MGLDTGAAFVGINEQRGEHRRTTGFEAALDQLGTSKTAAAER